MNRKEEKKKKEKKESGGITSHECKIAIPSAKCINEFSDTKTWFGRNLSIPVLADIHTQLTHTTKKKSLMCETLNTLFLLTYICFGDTQPKLGILNCLDAKNIFFLKVQSPVWDCFYYFI